MVGERKPRRRTRETVQLVHTWHRTINKNKNELDTKLYWLVSMIRLGERSVGGEDELARLERLRSVGELIDLYSICHPNMIQHGVAHEDESRVWCE